MQLTNTLTAICGATVLSLSLISCNKKDVAVMPTSNNKPWGISEPMIISYDGHETKYSEANTKANTSYSIDDRLVMKDISGASELRFRTSCARGEERVQYTDKFQAQNEFTLNEFIPAELFYSTHGEPFKYVTCALEITVFNAQGSRQTFPTLNLVMNDMSANKLELLYKMGSLSNSKMEIIQSTDLEEVTLPAITSDESISFQCETFVATSTDKYVRNLTDLKITSGKVISDQQKPQICRVIKLKGKSVKAVSSFFVIRFFDSTGIIGPNDDNIETIGLGMESVAALQFRKQKLINAKDKSIYLQIPRFINVTVTVRTISGAFVYKAILKIQTDANKTRTTNDKFVIEIKPGTSTSLVYKLESVIGCNYAIHSIALSVDDRHLEINAVSLEDDISLRRFGFITEEFKPFISTMHNLPAGADNQPALCTVNPQ